MMSESIKVYFEKMNAQVQLIEKLQAKQMPEAANQAVRIDDEPLQLMPLRDNKRMQLIRSTTATSDGSDDG